LPPFLALNLRKKMFYFSMEAYIVHLAKGIRIFGTHMEHLSSCQSGFLVVWASQSSVFWLFLIFCQPLNICLFVMLYLYI
jgi:hypothetical protein